jgi:cell division protein FtsA
MAALDPKFTLKPRAVATEKLIGALDIGAAKALCLIGAASEEAPLRIRGIGAASVRLGAAGPSLEYDTAVRSIRVALDQAERMAGGQIQSVAATYSGPGVSTRRVIAQIDLPGGVVSDAEARAAIAAAVALARTPGREHLHIVPLAYQVNDGELTPDPRGLEGAVLKAEVAVISAPAPAIDALRDCARDAGLSVSDLVAAPYAAGLAALSPEEQQGGAIVIDLGAATTGVAVFAQGVLMHAETLPIGANALTAALAQTLETPFPVAERLKQVHDVFSGAPNMLLEIARPGPDGRLASAHIARGALADALRPVLNDIFRRVDVALKGAKLPEGAKRWRVALTGGGAELPGLRDVAQALLNRPVRIARPLGFPELDHACAGAALAAPTGLLRWRVARPPEVRLVKAAPTAKPSAKAAAHAGVAAAKASAKLSQAFSWLRRNF